MLQPNKKNKKPNPVHKYKKPAAGDSLMEDIVEIFDPTGITSYDDVYRSYKKNGLLSWQTGLEVLGALPIIGKVGKGIKTVNLASKYLKTLNKVNKTVAKAEKVVPKVLKFGKQFGTAAQKVSKGGKANPIAAASIGVGMGADALQKLTKIIEKGTAQGVKKVISKAPAKKVAIKMGAQTLNTVNTLSDVAGAVQGQLPKKEEVSTKAKKPRVVYYNTDSKRGEVEKPGDEEGVQYVPVSNSVQLEKWKAQNNVPVTSDLKTKITREFLGTVLPDQAAQFLTAIATKDSKLGLQDLTPDIQEAVIKSVKNAQKRTGKNQGGTEYIDYNSEVEKAFQGMSAGKKQMLSTDPDIQAATMLGRVSYKKNALGETEIYDSYDFSKTNPQKADTFYKKVRAYAGVALPDEGKQPNLIGKIPAEEPLAFGTGEKGIGDPPTRFAFENELMSKVITERNKDKNFVQRAISPFDYPKIVNEDASETTHLMQYSTDDNGNAYVSPTVIQNELGLLSQLTPREAVKYGRQSGEEIKIPDVQLAEYYTENGLIKHGYGTNSQGIMKSKMNPRKKYANGSSAKGMNPNNYIVSPAETLNDYDIMMAKVENQAINNPWAPYVAAIGGAAQSFVGNANNYLKKPDGADGAGSSLKSNAGNILKESINTGGNITAVAANGTNNIQQDVEVEGGEMYETPQGETGEFKGPSHEQGGISLEVGQDVQEGTKVYSDRLKVGDKTLAERKATRERQTANLEKIASQPLVDQAVKNATKRKMMVIQKEEMADLDFQEKVNNMQQMADNMVAAFGTGMAGLQANPIGESMRYAGGTGVNGVQKYQLGTDEKGIDPITGKKLPKAPTADMDLNIIKNLHDILGIASTEDGYGTHWGNKSNTALFNYQVASGNKDALASKAKGNTMWGNTKEDMLSGDYPKMYKSMGLTPEGYKYLDPEAPSPIDNTKTWDKSAFGNAPVEINPMDVVTGQGGSYFQDNVKKTISQEPASNLDVQAALNGTGMFAKTTGKENAEKPTAMGNLMRSLPGMGDAIKLFGNYKGMTAGIDTATEQRASDVTNTNVYKNAGEEAQRLLDNAKQGIETSKAQAIVKANANTRTGKKGARNSARGVNQMRGMDWLYDTALNTTMSDIIAGAAQQMVGIDTQKSGVSMNADQLKGQGEWQAKMANTADKDAYYTALGQGRKDFATGLQQSGADLNDMKENKVIQNLMKQYGKYFSADDSGNLGNKNVASTKEKEQIVIGPDGKTKFKVGKNNQLIPITT